MLRYTRTHTLDVVPTHIQHSHKMHKLLEILRFNEGTMYFLKACVCSMRFLLFTYMSFVLYCIK